MTKKKRSYTDDYKNKTVDHIWIDPWSATVHFTDGSSIEFCVNNNEELDVWDTKGNAVYKSP